MRYARRWVTRTPVVVVALVSLAACSTGTRSSTDTASSQESKQLSGITSPSRPVPSVVIRGQLLFTRTTEGDVQTIYAMSGHRERRLTVPGHFCCLLRVSPDHRRILVMPGGDITPPVTGGTINLNGGHFQRLKLTDPTLNLVPQAWSPSGPYRGLHRARFRRRCPGPSHEPAGAISRHTARLLTERQVAGLLPLGNRQPRRAGRRLPVGGRRGRLRCQPSRGPNEPTRPVGTVVQGQSPDLVRQRAHCVVRCFVDGCSRRKTTHQAVLRRARQVPTRTDVVA